jgi:hypothetical protein
VRPGPGRQLERLARADAAEAFDRDRLQVGAPGLEGRAGTLRARGRRVALQQLRERFRAVERGEHVRLERFRLRVRVEAVESSAPSVCEDSGMSDLAGAVRWRANRKWARIYPIPIRPDLRCPFADG